MKFIHLADLHLGKMLHQYSLLPLQRELLEEITNYIKDNHIDAVVIAGDVYDHSVPSHGAVNLLNDFLNSLVNTLEVKVMMIAGNHDSADRLHFASSILESRGLYIETHLQKEMRYIEFDRIRFYLLPFFKPVQFQDLFPEEKPDTYNDAMKGYLDKQEIDPSYMNILVTHQYVGHNARLAGSEMTLSVGGGEVIDPHLFEAFDYVALGHLHAPQYLSRPTIRYSGSLMRYSFDEAHQAKSFTVVDTRDLSITTVPLEPSKDVRVYEGYFDDFRSAGMIEKRDDLIAIELLDDQIIPQAIDTLRLLYPNVLQLTYPQLLKTHDLHLERFHKVRSMSLDELYNAFYQEMTGNELDENAEEVVKQLLEEAGEKHAAK